MLKLDVSHSNGKRDIFLTIPEIINLRPHYETLCSRNIALGHFGTGAHLAPRGETAMILITAAVCTLPERLKKNWAQITKFHYCMQMLHDAPRCTFRRLLRSTSEEATLPQDS